MLSVLALTKRSTAVSTTRMGTLSRAISMGTEKAGHTFPFGKVAKIVQRTTCRRET